MDNRGPFSYILNIVNKFPKYLTNISDIGINRDEDQLYNRLGIPRKTTEIKDEDVYDTLLDRSNIYTDQEYPFYNKKYQERLRYIREICKHPEIEFIINSICNEAINIDDDGYFARLSMRTRTNNEKEYNEEITTYLEEQFNRLYSIWGFGEDNTAWSMFKKFIEEGYLAYEIVWDDIKKPTKIESFQELEPSTLVPIYSEIEEEEDGNKVIVRKKTWKQIITATHNNNYTSRIRVGSTADLPDESIIFLSYDKAPGKSGKVSYAERLVRSFNMLRTVEACIVGWHIMNAQSRVKIIVPVSSRSTGKAKSALGKVASRYKEQVSIDHNSGEVFVNGQPNINFSKNYILPSRSGAEPKIEAVESRGQDLSKSDIINYFSTKLQRDSNMPFSRFDRNNGGGIEFNSDRKELTNDEKNYYLFINRLRSEFKKVITRPLKLQLMARFPEFKIDPLINEAISVKYNSPYDFQESIKIGQELKILEQIDKYLRLKDENGNQVYSTKYLVVEKFGLMTEKEWEENEKLKEENKTDEDQSRRR